MRIEGMSFDELLARTAEKSPTPGGGAVAAAVGALGAALGSMVVAYSRGRKDLVESESMLGDAAGTLVALRGVMLDLASADAAAYTLLNEAMKLPKDQPGRGEAVAAAAWSATSPPLELLGRCVELMGVLEGLVGRSNTYLRSDLAIAAVLAEAAARAAAWNVRINLPMVGEAQQREARERVEAGVRACAAALGRIEPACA